jgi:hypothetical protein
LAAPDQGRPYCGAIEYSARFQIHRLRFPSRAILDLRLFSRLTSKASVQNDHIKGWTEKHTLRKVTLSPSVGLWGQEAGKTAESFRGLRAIGGAPHGAARRRRRRRSPDIHPGASRPIVTAKWFRRSCRAENGGTKQRPESAPEEMSFPVLPPEATPIPSVRGLRRTRRNGSSEGLRISLRGSNRVTFSFGARGILPLLLDLTDARTDYRTSGMRTCSQ